MNFLEQNFAMEPILVVFAECNIAIWGQNRESNFREV